MKKKICILLFILIFTMIVWHFITIIQIKQFEINTLTRTISKQQEQLQDELNKLNQEKENEIQLLLEEINRLRIIRARVTAYAPLDNRSGICADKSPNTTSRGLIPRRGIMAVDPSKIQYGTKVYIPKYGIASAEDTGGVMRNYNGIAIDVVVDTHEEAINWGVKYIDVIIQ